MNWKEELKHFPRDFIRTSKEYQYVVEFIQKHRLWEGMMDYSWFGKFLFYASILAGLGLVRFTFKWWGNADTGQLTALSAVGGYVSGLFTEGLFVLGGLKYVVLVLMEVIIFHFVRRTLAIITGDEVDQSFKTFVTAQIRMLKVVLFSFLMETVWSILVGVAIGMVGLDAIKPVVIILIQCFFLGFAIVDNYNEIYHMNIKQSFRYTKVYAGVAFAVGIVVYVMMLIPLLGAIVGPLTGAIVATIVMHDFAERDQKMEAVLATTDGSTSAKSYLRFWNY